MTSWLSLTLVLKRVAIFRFIRLTYTFSDNRLSKSWRKRKHNYHLSYGCLAYYYRVRNNKCFFLFLVFQCQNGYKNI